MNERDEEDKEFEKEGGSEEADIEEPDLPWITWTTCENCGQEYNQDGNHSCDPTELDNCETIYCEPVCPKCNKDEMDCDGKREELDKEPELEPEEPDEEPECS